MEEASAATGCGLAGLLGRVTRQRTERICNESSSHCRAACRALTIRNDGTSVYDACDHLPCHTRLPSRDEGHLQRLREALIPRGLAGSIGAMLKLFEPSVRKVTEVPCSGWYAFQGLARLGTGGQQALDTDLAG
jgi:hypothetical protein